MNFRIPRGGAVATVDANQMPTIYPDPYIPIAGEPTQLVAVRGLGTNLSSPTGRDSFQIRVSDTNRTANNQLDAFLSDAPPAGRANVVATVTRDMASADQGIVRPAGIGNGFYVQSVRVNVAATTNNGGINKSATRTVEIPVGTPPPPNCTVAVWNNGSPAAPLAFNSPVSFRVTCRGIVTRAVLTALGNNYPLTPTPRIARSITNQGGGDYTLWEGAIPAQHGGGARGGAFGARWIANSISLSYFGVQDEISGSAARTTAAPPFYVWALPTCRVAASPSPALSDDVVTLSVVNDDSHPYGGGPFTWRYVWDDLGGASGSGDMHRPHPPAGARATNGYAAGPGYSDALGCGETRYPVDSACPFLRASPADIDMAWFGVPGWGRRYHASKGHHACWFVNNAYFNGDWQTCSNPNELCIFTEWNCHDAPAAPFQNATYVKLGNVQSRHCNFYQPHNRPLGCFHKDTKLMMASGEERVMTELRDGDKLFNPATGRPVKVRLVRAGPEAAALWRVRTDAGDEVLVTHDHAFVTERGILTTKQLAVGDRLKGREFAVAVVAVAEDKVTEHDVYNVELESESGGDDPMQHMVLANGIPTGDLKLQERLKLGVAGVQ